MVWAGISESLLKNLVFVEGIAQSYFEIPRSEDLPLMEEYHTAFAFDDFLENQQMRTLRSMYGNNLKENYENFNLHQ